MTTDLSPLPPPEAPDEPAEAATLDAVALMTDDEFFAWLETQPEALGWGV